MKCFTEKQILRQNYITTKLRIKCHTHVRWLLGDCS